MAQVNVFVSFDTEHDAELYERLLAQSTTQSLGFSVTGSSTRSSVSDASSERMRRGIREADQVIVLCGERTAESMSVFDELRIAQEEEKPCLLLWGRREVMCTKPAGSRPAEPMYSWTPQILQTQIELASQLVAREAVARDAREAKARVHS